MEDIERIEHMGLEELKPHIPEVRQRLNRFRTALGRFFVAKQPLIDLMTICAVAQEPLLLVGPPGTAKSALVTKFRDALGVPETEWFEYMLTRFTEPSEVLGPIDVQQLREGRYLRRVEGRLPTARLVFLDEIFKSNSAILNALLTVINERKYYQDGRPVPVRLRVLFAATNDVPEQTELAALKDRFSMKCACRSVQEDHFTELLDLGLDATSHHELHQTPWVEGHASLGDLVMAHRYLAFLLAQRRVDADGNELRDRHRFFPEALIRELRRLVRTLDREDGVFVSDRKLIKLYRLIRARAWLLRGGTVQRDDLRLLAYLGESLDQIELLEEKVPRLLGIS